MPPVWIQRNVRLVSFLTAIFAFGSSGIAGAAEADPADRSLPRRLVIIKADGLPPDLMAAVALPERNDLMGRLAYAEDLRAAIREYRQRTGRQIVLPNIRKHFYEDGVVFDNMYSHTLTLSAVAWSIIETGQPSIVKGHGTFSRDNGYLRSHLDGLRDTVDALKSRPGHGEFKTSATWKLDQVGVSLMVDAFDPLRTWTGPQIYQRMSNRELLLEGGLKWLKADQEGFGGIVRGHLSRLVTGIDYTEFNQEMNAFVTARKVLDRAHTGEERFDFISPFFTLMDHQQHVDPHPTNLVHWLVKLDESIGHIFAAIAESDRREDTIVALASDHGSEIKPGITGYSFPISRVFREPLFGSHNVKTLLVENAFSAVSIPVPGFDWPRLYESRFSPYNKRGNPRFGSKGYATAFLDPFGNGRAAVHLRNNDLNRLHLILLELKKKPGGQRFDRLKKLFKETLSQTRAWLEPDLQLYQDYQDGARDLAGNLRTRIDRRSHDTARRLLEEIQRDRRQIVILNRLLNIRFDTKEDPQSFDKLFSGSFDIEDFIPKQYLGSANSLYQLAHYTLGLDEDLNWVETTVDHQGRPVPMNYFEIVSNYRAANAPAEGLENPFDFMVARVPVRESKIRLVESGLVEEAEALSNVIWVKSTDPRLVRRGGEALIVETPDRRIKYIPVRGLQQLRDGSIRFELADDIDPLALLKDPAFSPSDPHAPPLEWMRTFHFWRDWLPAIHRTEYSSGIIVLLDVLADAATRFVDNPKFQAQMVHFSSDELKRRYLRGLKRKYASQAPDFLIWSDELWNFNSKARTSGGNHSGLRPITTRTVFVLWGGEKTGLPRGVTVKEVSTTLDIVPTLFHALGLLDAENRVVPLPGFNPEHNLFLPFPGRAVNLPQAGSFAQHAGPGGDSFPDQDQPVRAASPQ